MMKEKRDRHKVGSPPKALDKQDVERAMRNTSSNKQAARYLGVSYPTYKKYATMFKDDEGIVLFEKHKNISGKGISKMTLRKDKNRYVGIMDILEGRVNPLFFDFNKIKEYAIREGVIEEKCCRCGFKEPRILDKKVPVILTYKDGNKKNLKLENLEFLCYNCHFLMIGDVYLQSQVESLENYSKLNAPKIDLQLEPIHDEKIREQLNLQNEYVYKSDDSENRKEDFGNDLIAFKKYM